MRMLAAATLVLMLAACGGGSSPTAPTAPPPAAPAPTPTPAPPAPTPTPAPTPVPDPEATTVIRSASIRGANGHAARGTARIVRRGDGTHRLELGSDFRIDSGNNDVYLTRGEGGIQPGDLNLGAMKALSGAQSYGMPGPGSDFAHVMLWCRPFQVPIGVGSLE